MNEQRAMCWTQMIGRTVRHSRRFRCMWSRQKVAPSGLFWRFGVHVGYWPCLRAPFIKLDLGLWNFSVWYGWPTYKAPL